ncbi:hypothetical protein LAZ67_22002412 [Cordylochernes scorpioides]|uniref:Endonuclease/exonuclease/phosphatase domain-containing protein n=1 Tax=Cordylochernes scorpioides TaxID=51811 RepID=A0ABY6LPK8_9ARAC|nr:hypothetical protein LAZ67_22002412 [Cordylochernes scorpioides]
MGKLQDLRFKLLGHPPYSPDLASISSHTFASNEEVERAVDNSLFKTHFRGRKYWRNAGPNGGGGLLTLIKDLSFEEIVTPSTTQTELQAFKIHLPNQRPLTIVNTYHPPQKPGPELDLVAHLLDPNILILGDFKSKHQSWGCSLNNTEGSAPSLMTTTSQLCLLRVKIKTPLNSSLEDKWKNWKSAVLISAKQNISRGNRKFYIPGYREVLDLLKDEIEDRNQVYKDLIENNNTLLIRDYNHLAAKIKLKADQIKQNKWIELCSSINPKTRNTKLWRLLHIRTLHLTAAQIPSRIILEIPSQTNKA